MMIHAFVSLIIPVGVYQTPILIRPSVGRSVVITQTVESDRLHDLDRQLVLRPAQPPAPRPKEPDTVFALPYDDAVSRHQSFPVREHTPDASFIASKFPLSFHRTPMSTSRSKSVEPRWRHRGALEAEADLVSRRENSPARGRRRVCGDAHRDAGRAGWRPQFQENRKDDQEITGTMTANASVRHDVRKRARAPAAYKLQARVWGSRLIVVSARQRVSDGTRSGEGCSGEGWMRRWPMRYHRCPVRNEWRRTVGIAGSSGAPTTSGLQGCGCSRKSGQKPSESKDEEVAPWPG